VSPVNASGQSPPAQPTRDEKHAIVQAASLVGFLTLLSRVAGLARDLVVAYLFGTGSAADTFFVAFRIPNLLRRLVGEGAVAVAFVPVVTDYLTHRPRAEAMAMVRALATFMAMVLALLTAAGVLFAGPLAVLFAPGFSGAKIELTVALIRITFPYLFFIGLVAMAMGVLHSLRHFAAPAFSPVLLNLAMIACALLLSPRLQEPIFSLAYGVVVGGVCQLLIQLPALKKFGVPLRPLWKFSHPAIRRVLFLLLPTLFGAAVYQINIVVSTIFASLLPEGSVSYLSYAGRLFEFPLGVLVVALGTAALPSFATQVKRKDYQGLHESLRFSLRLVNLTVLPAAVGLFVLATPITVVLFHRGMFDGEAVLQTAWALRCFAVGLWSVAAVRLLSSCFYALEDTRTPVFTAAAAFIANFFLSLMLMGQVTAGGEGLIEKTIATLSTHLALVDLRHGGLALATSLSATVNLLLLGMFLRRHLGGFRWGEIAVSFTKNLLAALLMVWPVQAVAGQIDWLNPTGSLLAQSAVLLGAMVAGGVIFGVSIGLLDKTGVRELAPSLFRFVRVVR